MAGDAAGPSPSRQPLDDVMLAMDVVDTLRRRERLVTAELGDADRRADLKARLHEIYDAQGIDVPDRILEEGVAALTENRFVFDPPRDSFAVRVANFYVARNRWGPWVLGGIAAVLLLFVVHYTTVTLPTNRLGPDLAGTYEEIVAVSDAPEAIAAADELLAAGRDALSNDQPEGARTALASLETLRDSLLQSYTLRIVNRGGELSGVWRIPDVNEAASNYYLIVEALGPSGNPVRVAVENEETGQVDQVSTWGIRVDKEIFDAVAADKRDDGIIQNDVFGGKARGALEPDYAFPTTGAAITRW
jgi:hypothetical protein